MDATIEVIEIRRPGLWALWFGLFGAMGAWAIQFGVNYILVYNACGNGWEFSLYVFSAAAIATAVAADAIAWRSWQIARRDRLRTVDVAWARGEFMAFAGILLSGLFTLLILMTAVTPIFLPPCG
jgi:hypothetical protein